MGSGIALVTAIYAKKNVLVTDMKQSQVDLAQKGWDDSLAIMVKKGKLTSEEGKQARSRLSASTKIKDLAPVDFWIEAVSEDVNIKKSIFKDVNEITRPEVILASNTSSISITKLAAATTRPDKVIGMHFFHPVRTMTLVEIISGLGTSAETLNTTTELAKAMGKTTTTSKNAPGFIANRVLMPYINEAFYVLEQGIATPEDIDTTMTLGTKVPMGPLTLADYIGLDTCLSIMKVLHEGLGDSKYRPCPLLQEYVDAGRLGNKNGRGVFTHP
jgi:3-hydroxybutyryl-CoA dehydrogenase